MSATISTAERHQLQCLFLSRLRRLVDLRRSWDPSWTLADSRLVNQALYSTSRDSERLGLHMVARAVLDELRRR